MSKKTLKLLIENTVLIPEKDKKLLLDKLNGFTKDKIKTLISLLKSEEKVLDNFYIKAQKIHTDYGQTLRKDKRKVYKQIEKDTKGNADEMLENSLSQI
jgi:hypothetical protein